MIMIIVFYGIVTARYNQILVQKREPTVHDPVEITRQCLVSTSTLEWWERPPHEK